LILTLSVSPRPLPAAADIGAASAAWLGLTALAFDYEEFDDVDLDLGAKNGVRLSLALQRDLGKSTSLWLRPWFEYWELGRNAESDLLSHGIPVGTVFEPDSETSNFGISLGVSWRFGDG